MTTKALMLDFEAKELCEIELSKVQNFVDEGNPLWLHLDGTNTREALEQIRQVLPKQEWLQPIVGLPPTEPIFELNPDYLRLAGWACWSSTNTLSEGWFDIVASHNFVLTINRNDAPFIHHVRASYQHDFEKFAQSTSFLLYEVLDAVFEGYRKAVVHFEKRVSKVQTALLRGTREDTFEEVSQLQLELVRVRRHLAPLREALSRLSRRKSEHVSEATRPYLLAFSDNVDRIMGDLSEYRNLLLDSLNLYMSIVGNRTNQIMNRLTVISFIFLPLSFICGIYGMNFRQPEYGWPNGYAYFWIIAVTWIAIGTFIMRRLRIL